MAALAPGTTVKTKKRCCKDGPRCKRCPAVWKRLASDGLAERAPDRRHYVVTLPVPKKALKAARAR